jgi:ADP-ribose pyrophosphatase YjhB (NUDIX family)
MISYCPRCGAPVGQAMPPGDDRLRDICKACGEIHYQNPKLVVGAIPEWEGRILLCRRAIEPRYALWTLPAGYLENGETTAAGAMRETLEESGAEIHDLVLFGLFDLVFVRQIYLMFRARMRSAHFQPGSESLEVRLFDPEAIPWDELAFAVIRHTLELYLEDRSRGSFGLHTGLVEPDPSLAQRSPSSIGNRP